MSSWLVDPESAVYSVAFGGLVSMGWSLMVSDAGVNFRRNLLFRTVSRLDPLIFTTYWSCDLMSTTMPDLSHLVG